MDITATQEMNSKASEIIPCAQETVVWIWFTREKGKKKERKKEPNTKPKFPNSWAISPAEVPLH